MNRTFLSLVVGALIIVGVAVAVTMPKETADESSPAATPPTPQTTQTDNSTPAASTAEAKAEIKNFAFMPASITVKKGTKVTWTNQDSARHDVMSDDGAPAGGPSGPLLGQGESYSFTFNTVGTFPYHCTPHPNMKGTVTVTE